MGKFLIITGIIILAVGLIIQFSDRVPFLGKMPGDFSWEGRNVKVYFPLATSILLSVLISVILYLINKARQ